MFAYNCIRTVIFESTSRVSSIQEYFYLLIVSERYLIELEQTAYKYGGILQEA